MKILATKPRNNFDTLLASLLSLYEIELPEGLFCALFGTEDGRVNFSIWGTINYIIPVGFWDMEDRGGRTYEVTLFDEIVGRCLLSVTDPPRSCKKGWQKR